MLFLSQKSFSQISMIHQKRNTLISIISACSLIILYLACKTTESLDKNSVDISVIRKEADESWEDVFFEEINKRIEGTKINDLRMSSLSPESKEIRVWIGFTHGYLQGVIFKQTEGDWLAIYIPQANRTDSLSWEPRHLPPPRSGWGLFWQKLESLGIYTIPDANEVNADNVYPDATSVVVEIKILDVYRTYKYSGYQTSEKNEQKKIKEIVDIIFFSEFGEAIQ